MCDDVADTLLFSPVGELMGDPEQPEALPDAPPPVTAEDENVKRAAEATRRRLQGTRAGAKLLAPKQTLAY